MMKKLISILLTVFLVSALGERTIAIGNNTTPGDLLGHAETAEDCSYGSEYGYDEDNHWLACTICGDQEIEAHSWTAKQEMNNNVTTNYKECQICEYKWDYVTVTVTVPEGLTYGATEGNQVSYTTVPEKAFTNINWTLSQPSSEGPQDIIPMTGESLDFLSADLAAGDYNLDFEGTLADDTTLNGSAAFTVQPAELTEDMVTLSETSVTYNGAEQKPAATVTGLTAGTDYTVAYEGDFKNAGAYAVTVTGKKNYAGLIAKEFTIYPATPTIVWDPDKQELTYTGQPAAIQPAVMLVNNETYSGTVQYSYAVQDSDEFQDGLPTDAGTYTVQAAIEESGNLTAASADMTLTITAARNRTAQNNGTKSVVEKFKAGTPMSVAHRAAWRTAPENSLLAIEAAINMNVDVVELDVAMTKDGVVVLSHDSTVSRCIDGNERGNISDYTWEQLRNMAVLDGQGGSVAPVYTLSQADADLLNRLPNYASHCGTAVAGGAMPLTRLDDALDLIGGRCMINLDKWFDGTDEEGRTLFAATYAAFRNAGMLDQVLFKHSKGVAYMNACYTAAAEAWNKDSDEEITADDVKNSILCVYVTSSADAGTSLMQPLLDNGDNLVMVEICITNDASDSKMRSTLEPWCQEHRIAMFVNTMWSGLCSTKPDTQTTWAEMLQRGYQMIQTDRPRELAQYLEALDQVRQTSERLEAEHFNNFSFDDACRLTVADPADATGNKYVEKIGAGDWMAYDNVVFDSSEKFLTIRAQGLADHSTITYYLDSINSDHELASFNLNQTSTYNLYTRAMNAVEAGRHKVYAVVSGAPDTDLVSLDYFIFSGAMDREIEIVPVSVTTAPGVAPKLPPTVSVISSKETYDLEVRWEQVPESWYADQNIFTILGYVEQLDTYVKAAVTVQPVAASVSTDGLKLWLDASQGVTTEDGTVKQWTSKVGSLAATLRTGSPTLVPNAVGSGVGVYFNGNAALDLDLGDTFWNGREDFTVLFFSSPEVTTEAGSGGATYGQRKTLLYFPQEADWGSACFSGSQNEIVFRIGSGERDDYGKVYVRKNPIGSMYTATAMRKDGLDNAVFVDRQLVWSGRSESETAKYITSSGYIGLGKYNEFFKGTVCEILIYDRALSDEEILAVQQYMAEKYSDTVASIAPDAIACEAGQAPALPETVRVNYEKGQAVDMGVSWSPSHSSGCLCDTRNLLCQRYAGQRTENHRAGGR